MTQSTNALHAANATPAAPDAIEHLTNWSLTSPSVARFLTLGVPMLGMVTSLIFGLPLFSALMAGGFLMATTLVCRRAILTFAGATLRLLVMSRVVLIFVLAALLFCTTGAVWMSLVSAVLLWLVSDRLLGRRALHDLYRLCRPRP
jgi:hypothetical protein